MSKRSRKEERGHRKALVFFFLFAYRFQYLISEPPQLTVDIQGSGIRHRARLVSGRAGVKAVVAMAHGRDGQEVGPGACLRGDNISPTSYVGRYATMQGPSGVSFIAQLQIEI